MAREYRDLTYEQRNKLFDDIQALLKEGVSINEIKLKIADLYDIADIWTCKSHWEIGSLEEFIRKVKQWSEIKIDIEDLH